MKTEMRYAGYAADDNRPNPGKLDFGKNFNFGQTRSEINYDYLLSSVNCTFWNYCAHVRPNCYCTQQSELGLIILVHLILESLFNL